MKATQAKTTRKRILFPVLAVLIFFVISNVYGLMKLSDVQEAMHWVTEYHVPLMKRLTSIDRYQDEQQWLVERLFCEKEGDSRAPQAQPVNGDALEGYEALSRAIERDIDGAFTQTERAIDLAQTEFRREAFRALAGSLAEIRQSHQALEESTRAVLSPREDRDAVPRQRDVGELTDARHRTASRVEQVLTEIEKLTEQEVLDAQRAEELAYLWMLIFTALALSGFAAAFRNLERLCRDQS